MREIFAPESFSAFTRYRAVVSPSTVGLVARITSWTEPRDTRSTRLAIRSWSGPMPSIGEMAPMSTWYSPRCSWMLSMVSTSRGSSTTQMVPRSRCASVQIPQGSTSV